MVSKKNSESPYAGVNDSAVMVNVPSKHNNPRTSFRMRNSQITFFLRHNHKCVLVQKKIVKQLFGIDTEKAIMSNNIPLQLTVL